MGSHRVVKLLQLVGVSSYFKASIDAHAPAIDTATEPRTTTQLHARAGTLRSHHPGRDRTRVGLGRTPTVHAHHDGEAVGGSLEHDVTRVRSVTIQNMVAEQSSDTALHHATVSPQATGVKDVLASYDQ